MRSLIGVTLCCVVAMACASPFSDGHDNDGNGGGYRGYGFRRTPDSIEAVYNNAARQLRVNNIAEHVGASSGTAYRYGVPGTGNYFPNDRYDHDDGYNSGY